MESRLARAGHWCSKKKLKLRNYSAAFIPTQRHADPAIHSENFSESDDAAAKTSSEEKKTEQKPTTTKGSTETLVPPKPPYTPSPKLEHSLEQPMEPTIQQKRSLSAKTTASFLEDDINCLGLDGGPWPDESEGLLTQREEQEEDDKEYFKHHKPSPLSEIEVADTRKPITRATDGSADDSYGDDTDVILFSDEQRDTADDALRRATEIWRENAMRGDPDSPHGKVLRALRGEI